MSKIPMLAALVAAFTANAQIAVPTDIRAKVPAPQPADWWSRSFEERQKKIESSGGSAVVFVGDSITHGWEWPDAGKTQWEKYFAGAPYNALQLGFSGDRTEHVLWRRAVEPVFDAVCAK